MTRLDRYSRQTLFQPIGKEGQTRLLTSSVALIGCGALGTFLANNLARAGVGKLLIADRDFIELNNLQRQILYEESDVTQRLPKAVAAAQRLHQINSDIQIETMVDDIGAEEMEEIAQNYDLILDATDNFETRYLINDASIKFGKPWIYSGVIASYGVTMNILPGDTACLRCVFPDEPLPGTTPTCDTAGVLNGIVGAITGIASTETLKILLHSDKINRGMRWLDLWENTTEQIELPKIPDCPACGQHKYAYLEAEETRNSTSLCGRNAVQVRGGKRGQKINLADLMERLRPVGEVAGNEYLVRLTVDTYELTIFPDARAIIKGTNEPQVARTLYARYVGA